MAMPAFELRQLSHLGGKNYIVLDISHQLLAPEYPFNWHYLPRVRHDDAARWWRAAFVPSVIDKWRLASQLSPVSLLVWCLNLAKKGGVAGGRGHYRPYTPLFGEVITLAKTSPRETIKSEYLI